MGIGRPLSWRILTQHSYTALKLGSQKNSRRKNMMAGQADKNDKNGDSLGEHVYCLWVLNDDAFLLTPLFNQPDLVVTIT